MRALLLGLSGLCTAIGCGEGAGDGGKAAGSAGQSVSGASGSAASAGKGGSSAGTSSAGSSSAGSSNGGAAGKPSAGSGSGGDAAGTASGGSDQSEAGSPSGGGASGLAECNPKQVTCKALPPQCPANQVPSVDGTCWGECVKIDQCACSVASDCPDQNQYTCWSKQHCGPFVE
jgi:hypothetical protein